MLRIFQVMLSVHLLIFAVSEVAQAQPAAGVTTTVFTQITVSGDVDGIPGNEKIVGTSNGNVTVTYASGRVQKFTVTNFFNNIQLVNLNTAPGFEILLTGQITYNGFPINPEVVTVINSVQNTVIAYNVGPWSNFLLGEVNGETGTDVVFHDANNFPGGTNVSVLMRESGVVQAFPYPMPQQPFGDVRYFNNVLLTNLNEAAGDEIVLTLRVTLNGVPDNGLTVVVISAVQNSLRAFQVLPWTNFQVTELNGSPGNELLFDNRFGIYLGNAVSILMRENGALGAFTFGPLAHFDALYIENLDGGPGENILLLDSFILNGSSDNGPVVSVITPRANAVQPYTIGNWVSFAVQNVDGVAGLEVVFNMANKTKETLYQRLGLIK